MTLVAALEIENVPAVIADFITTDEGDGKHAFTPTRPTLNDPDHPKLARRIAGVRRKLLLVNPRLIVAYTTTDLNVAAPVLAILQQRFGKSAGGQTLREIEDALSPFNNRCSGKLTIIGWTVRSRPRCFKWVAGADARVKLVAQAIEGSGRAL
jgi:hypothetical protein